MLAESMCLKFYVTIFFYSFVLFLAPFSNQYLDLSLFYFGQATFKVVTLQSYPTGQ